MAHHEKANRVHALITRNANMMFGNVGFCTMGGYPHRCCAQTMGLSMRKESMLKWLKIDENICLRAFLRISDITAPQYYQNLVALH